MKRSDGHEQADVDYEEENAQVAFLKSYGIKFCGNRMCLVVWEAPPPPSLQLDLAFALLYSISCPASLQRSGERDRVPSMMTIGSVGGCQVQARRLGARGKAGEVTPVLAGKAWESLVEGKMSEHLMREVRSTLPWIHRE